MADFPFHQERLVKTVGKAATNSATTPAPRPRQTASTAATPLAWEVKEVASVPLPDDQSGGETEPFASSEDELAGPASPEKVPHDRPHSVNQAKPERRAGSGGRLLGLFTLSSILATLSIALLLAPCTDSILYTQLRSPAYNRICKAVSKLHYTACSKAEDASWRIRAVAEDKLRPLHAKLPAEIQQFMAAAWAPVRDAHSDAWTALTAAAGQLNERTAPYQQAAKDAYLRATRSAFLALAPAVREAVSRVSKALPALGLVGDSTAPGGPAAAATGSSTGSSSSGPAALLLSDFLAQIDQTPQQQQYARELWHAAERQVSNKQKAVTWVLACRHSEECAAVADALRVAAVSAIWLDGSAFGTPDAAGQLQAKLASFLRASPTGLVLVSSAERLHTSCVAVLNAAVSESGHLQMDGAPVVTSRALFVFLVEDPLVAEGAAAGDADVEQAVKERLCDAIAAVRPETTSAPATILSFRRRLDGVLLVRKI